MSGSEQPVSAQLAAIAEVARGMNEGLAVWGRKYAPVFEAMAKAVNEALEPGKLMRQVFEEYNRRMAEINRR